MVTSVTYTNYELRGQFAIPSEVLDAINVLTSSVELCSSMSREMGHKLRASLSECVCL